jgi:energy-coupling factor transporter ATP-binding protein EcfA2
MPQAARFPDNLTGEEVLALLAKLRGGELRHDGVLRDALGLTAETLARPVRTLSGGTRQKLSAIVALRHEAPVLILDEPTAGLDPLTSSHLKELVRQRATSGAAVLLTSHVMAEVEELADALVYLVDGRVRFRGSLDELRLRTGQRTGRACHCAPHAGGGVNAARMVLGYSLSNLRRNWWVLGYGLLFLFLTDALFRFGGGGPRVAASLMNVVLIVIPLVSVVFGTLYFSNSREFIELLLAQPVSRPSTLHRTLLRPGASAGARLWGRGGDPGRPAWWRRAPAPDDHAAATRESSSLSFSPR